MWYIVYDASDKNYKFVLQNIIINLKQVSPDIHISETRLNLKN